MNVFEQIKEKLIMKLNYSSGYPNCSEYDYAYECAMSDARKQAIEILEQVEKEHKREEQAIAKLHEFIERFDVSYAEDVYQRDTVNKQCVDLVSELVEILKGE